MPVESRISTKFVVRGYLFPSLCASNDSATFTPDKLTYLSASRCIELIRQLNTSRFETFRVCFSDLFARYRFTGLSSSRIRSRSINRTSQFERSRAVETLIRTRGSCGFLFSILFCSLQHDSIFFGLLSKRVSNYSRGVLLAESSISTYTFFYFSRIWRLLYNTLINKGKFVKIRMLC